jgi:pyruvate, orthophosphate dikinase
VTFVYALDHRHDLSRDGITNLIGGKAAGLAVMTSELGLPVPPGFTITTEACRAFLSRGWPAGLDGELHEAMHGLERAMGRRFGDPENPLLVSVRSGAPVSMPGMMDTILDLGLNEETTNGLAALSGDVAFAADCRRRLVEMFTKTTGASTVPDEPWQQLRAAIEAVFRSWNSDRARAFRDREGIANDLGTAVTVQAMVFGNWGNDSATGVLFTRNPATGEPALYGDVLFASQGEDVVAGTHWTEPLAVLDARLPEVAGELRRSAEVLERHYADLCDVEFTIEQGKLWLLQVRVGKRSPQAALRIAVDMAEDPDFPLSRAEAVQRVVAYLANPPLVSVERNHDVSALATGLPASPGVAIGEIATTLASASSAGTAGRRVILVRSETSPEDVPGMAWAEGVLTSRGGLASHAAVLARAWGIPAVVGAEAVKVGDHEVEIGGHVLKVGDTITIDGGTGEIFAGVVEGSTTVAREVATLLAWATELGIAVSGAATEVPSVSERDTAATPDDVVRALVIKGSTTLEGLAAALLANSEHMRPLLDHLVADGLVEADDDAFRLTRGGKRRGQSQLAADQRRWGKQSAETALDAFLAMDNRVKEAVTAWQLREVDGAQAINDHTDSAYDAGVLETLGGVHQAAIEWMSSLSQPPPGLRVYLLRLERALASARGGDWRFVASPRVDSYHGIWFELHEELILLAGKNRADEAAAGRA